MKPYYPDAIDPHRPWIKDARDNPHDMNWGQVLFNPLGSSPKLHFTRAWTLMFMGRLLLFIVPVFAVFVASLAGANLSGLWKPVEALVLPIPELLLPFFVFTLVTELTSWVAHVRRFNEAHKSPIWAMIVLLPLMLGLVGFYLGAQGGIKKYEEMHAPKPAVTAEAPAGESAAAANTEAKPQQQQQRRRPGPPPSERDMAASSGFGFATMLWVPTSFLVMLWSLLYVARIPNGGVGRFRTGSDIAQGEEELPPAYAAG
ncbi:hypothetical protein [Hyphomonas sp. GM-8P]|uniref:hypothetical protein n=1 Tax=Hyphomonas sp. GM-8P TaxID=1280945 RepID=UPI000DBFF7E3|nr:hypothetical protein [Hyphomonas sp. GM-8P]RAN40140.1 hypothetical protein HY26_13290 [Hyphomonas sp. GM-8P]